MKTSSIKPLGLTERSNFTFRPHLWISGNNKNLRLSISIVSQLFIALDKEQATSLRDWLTRWIENIAE